MRRVLITLLVAGLLAACTGDEGDDAASDGPREEVSRSRVEPAPAPNHPRLWVTRADVERLRSYAVDDNPMWRDGLKKAAETAKQRMDEGEVEDGDGGSEAWEEAFSESYAELFAFLSLVAPDSEARADYGSRARELLMHVIDEASKGAASGEPFRDPSFSIRDRSRWAGEGFPLTVDWAYPYFSPDDKAKIRTTFARWIGENEKADTTSNNHPEPPNVTNDPALTADLKKVRWAGNNYYTAHMRNIGLMAMSLDPADDPEGTVRNGLQRATGAWLYVVDHNLRTDGRGGMLPEGLEYGPQTAGYVSQFLLALKTAGEADPERHGRQVAWDENPFWPDFVNATVHTLWPEPVWYGDGQLYQPPEMIDSLAPLTMHWGGERAGALRWIQQELVAGGREKLLERAGDPGDQWLPSILAFLMFEPGAPVGPDPRPSMPTSFHAPGLGVHLSRTSWDRQSTLFTYRLGYIEVDHQHGDGNQIELHRNGEWLVKERTGYGDNISASDYHNTVAIENDRPAHFEEGDYREPLWRRGSQWLVGDADGDGTIAAASEGSEYFYATGDATAVYNSAYEEATDVAHASRSVVWVKPDVVVVYDRTETRSDGRFKRFWLNLPAEARVDGRAATVETKDGQRLTVSSLSPPEVSVRSEPAEALEENSEPAENEPMTHRLRVEATGAPRATRFLHVLQAGDRGTPPAPVAAVRSPASDVEGAVVGDTVVVFAVNLGTPLTEIVYETSSAVQRHIVTGLAPNAAYAVSVDRSGAGVRVRITPGGDRTTDGGGVLAVR